MTDLCFMDTETLGLDPDAPIWEFAAVRRFAHGIEDRTEFRIRHDPAHWLDDFPAEFRADYDARYTPHDAMDPFEAAVMISIFTRGAHIIGAVPSFDTERLAKLLHRHGIEPGWHYHLIDVENVVVGWLHGVAARAIDEARMRGGDPDPALIGRHLEPPWKSDELSRAVGVNPEDYARHTAMGDVQWAMAQWDIVIGGNRQ